jgi:hypothetical protein
LRGSRAAVGAGCQHACRFVGLVVISENLTSRPDGASPLPYRPLNGVVVRSRCGLSMVADHGNKNDTPGIRA